MRAQTAIISALSITTIFAPLLASAATLFNILGTLNALFNGIMWLLIVVAIVVFFWGMVQYLFKLGGEGKGAENGVKLMLWSIIALFVMVSIWGIIRLLQQTFQVDSGAAILPGAIQGGVMGVPGSSGAQGVVNVSGGVSIPIR
ncbi:MAG TPA: hypothetical protein VJH69_00960 [Candidatus Paceibacterota bacterium]